MRLLCSSELASRVTRSVLRAQSSHVAVKVVWEGNALLETTRFYSAALGRTVELVFCLCSSFLRASDLSVKRV